MLMKIMSGTSRFFKSDIRNTVENVCELMEDLVAPKPDEPLTNWRWGLVDKIGEMREKITSFICRFLGHLPQHDQCGMPHHMYCRWCSCPTPDLTTENNRIACALSNDNVVYRRRRH
jgi:hypothetical protein